MPWDARVGWLLVGMAIGFIAGYIVRSLRELKEDVHDVKEELHEVDEIVKERLHREEGFVDNKVIANAMLVIVLIIVAWSAFASQQASNRVKHISACDQEFLTKTISALNERTTFTQAQAQKNVELQKAQADFLAFLLHRPPFPEDQRAKSATEYVETLNEFVTINNKASDKVEQNPYPTTKELQDCLN